jgi:O-antigen/teichoic acid export membrane protein
VPFFDFGPILIFRRNFSIEFRKMQIQNMRKLLYILPIALIVVGASLLFEQRAYAYADPGTGLLAIQALGSAVVATGWYLRRKIYGLLHRGAKPQQPAEEFPAAEEDEGSSHP